MNFSYGFVPDNFDYSMASPGLELSLVNGGGHHIEAGNQQEMYGFPNGVIPQPSHGYESHNSCSCSVIIQQWCSKYVFQHVREDIGCNFTFQFGDRLLKGFVSCTSIFILVMILCMHAAVDRLLAMYLL
ncbi:hypothetical protein LINGRAHAP2_LOCUS34184 [Linum grandiflorum]